LKLYEHEAKAILANYGVPKPVVAYVAGRSAPPEKRMGHAGAIILGDAGTAAGKVAAFESVGVRVAEKLGDLGKLLREAGFGAKGISEG
jgi:succinyl-CoA synthetase alpha subunit